MSKILWSSRFELGIPFIDNDHKTLVELLNRMNDASRTDGNLADIGAILSALLDYTKYHFAREERAQSVAGYPDTEEHHDQHVAIAGKVQALFEQFRLNPASLDVGDLLDFLSDWLMDHILLHDMSIKPYVQSSRDAILAAEGMTYAGMHSESQKGDEVDWPNVSILIVEDSKAFASVLRAILQSIGVGNVLVTHTVADAAQAIADQSFNVVLCDWRIGDEDGLSIIRTIDENNLKLPVVMLSGFADESLENVGRHEAVAEWMQKPITSTELTSCLMRHL